MSRSSSGMTSGVVTLCNDWQPCVTVGCAHGSGIQPGRSTPRCTSLPISHLVSAVLSLQRAAPVVITEEPSAPAVRRAAARYGCTFPPLCCLSWRECQAHHADGLHMCMIFCFYVYAAEQRGRRSVWRVQAGVLPPITIQPWRLSALFLHGRHQTVCQLLVEQRGGDLLHSLYISTVNNSLHI